MHNAFIIDASGEIKTSACIGDGIEHVQIDRKNRIWVGYFDEGVFSDNPINISGLTRWTTELEREWYLAYQIADLYALNVTGPSVVFCPYPDFPYIQIDADDCVSFKDTNGKIAGPKAIAKHRELVLFAGEYRNPLTCIVADLSTEYREISRFNVELPVAPTDIVSMQGCGSKINYHTVDNKWYILDLADF